MINLIKTFPEQLKEALQLTEQIRVSDFSTDSVQHIVISGMGGSGIGAHLVKSVVEEHCTVPITLIQGYCLPNWLNKNTLFIACSYSGNTEETLTLLELAEKKTQHIFSITTGGKLKAISDNHKFPQYNFSGKSESPRAGLAYPSGAILMLVYKLGFCPGLNVPEELKSCITHLEKEQAEIQMEAQEIVNKIKGYFTFLYSDQKFYPAALRFQQQLAENSKQLSHANVFPELNHNELVGWVFPAENIEKSKAVLLRSDFDHPRNSKRMDISKSIIQEKAEVIEIYSKGEGFIQQLYYIIHMIDWISYYLAEANQIDPFPVKSIDFLKSKLAE